MRAWRRRAVHAVMLLVLVAGGVKGLDCGLRHAPLPQAATRFLRYFERLDGTAHPGWWERFAVSLLLSRNSSPARANLGAPGLSRPT